MYNIFRIGLSNNPINSKRLRHLSIRRFKNISIVKRDNLDGKKSNRRRVQKLILIQSR